MLGREVNLPIELALGAVAEPQKNIEESQYVSGLRGKLDSIYQLVRNSFKMKLPKKDSDSRLSSKTYKIGDLVYYHDSTRSVGKSPKLKSDVWKGPCVITRKFSDLLFEIKSHSVGKSKILHFDRLKPYTSDSVPELVQKLRKNILPRDDPGRKVSPPMERKNSGRGKCSKQDAKHSKGSEPSKSNDPGLRKSQRQRKRPERLGL